MLRPARPGQSNGQCFRLQELNHTHSQGQAGSIRRQGRKLQSRETRCPRPAMSGGQRGSGQIINPSAQDAVWARRWGAGERRWGEWSSRAHPRQGARMAQPPASGLLPFHQSCF